MAGSDRVLAVTGTDSGETMTARLRGPVRAHWPLWLALVAVLAGRAALFTFPLYSDEAGFYLVARDLLHGGSGQLYGDYWVDRPPLLIGLCLVGAAAGTPYAMRVLLAGLLLAFVVLSYAVARRIGTPGRPASPGWAVAVAAAGAVSPLFGAEAANGEALALPFVMGGILLVVLADRGSGAKALLLSAGAGLAGVLAAAVKQNFVDALVFAVVWLLAAGLRGERGWADIARRLLAGAAGVLVGCLVMVGYALTTPVGVGGLWTAVVGFRLDADPVLQAGHRTGIDSRFHELARLSVVGGLVPFLVVLVALAVLGRLRGSALTWAVGALVGFEALAVLGGGNFWPHYLVGTVPGLVLAAALWGHRVPVAAVASYVVLASVLSVPAQMAAAQDYRPDRHVAVGHLVRDSAEPGDTLTTLYGHAELQWASGLPSPYPHLWSLPVRVLDPDLVDLAGLLDSPRGPTWIVEVTSPHEWGLDPRHRIDPVLERRYRTVSEACGLRVLLRRGEDRRLAPAPAC